MIERLFRVVREERESGQALVELAVTLPLLLLILLGGVEFARLDYTAIEVSNSARAAAQYAVMNGGAAGDTGGVTKAAQNDSYNLGSAVTSSVTSTSCVCANDESTAVSCSPAAICTGSYLLETVTVTTSATYQPLLKLPILPSSFTLHGYAQEMVLP